jgi:hypothetical protein
MGTRLRGCDEYHGGCDEQHGSQNSKCDFPAACGKREKKTCDQDELFFSTFQNTGTGAVGIPLMLLRAAIG